ncbi:hypothetical protein SH668x_002502 [Planctomicrobium sp. SH668]|uniref:hypothetical protein n=1 Tax=Planctomicrobium sp. SH668 TaxID=3448126 RepID=UPI003F5B6264
MKPLQMLLRDETGFIVSAELVLIATLLVLGMIVGLSQVQHAVVEEMNDVAHAIGSLNQSYFYSGFRARKWGGWMKSATNGSAFHDFADTCDAWGCQIACAGAQAEGGVYGGYGYGGGAGGGSASGSCAAVPGVIAP